MMTYSYITKGGGHKKKKNWQQLKRFLNCNYQKLVRINV